MSLIKLVLDALLNVIPSTVAGNIVPYSLPEMRLGQHRKDVVIHPQPFSVCNRNTKETHKPWNVRGGLFVRDSRPKKLFALWY